MISGKREIAGRATLADEFCVVVPIDVRYRDLDTLGHVNNAVYLSYLEVARVAYYQRLHQERQNLSFGFVVANICIDYHRPLFLGEQIWVGIKVKRFGNKSFTFAYEIRESESGELVATAESVQVTVDEDGKHTIPVSDDLRARVARLEGREL